MKRAGMIKGTRRSAKQATADYAQILLRMLESENLPEHRQKEFRNHLGAILEISRRMNWDDITTRLTKFIRSHPTHS